MKQLLVVVVVVAMSGCTSGDPHDPQSLPADPCNLVTERDVERVMGATVVRSGPASSRVDPDMKVCEYEMDGPYTSLSVVVDPSSIDEFIATKGTFPEHIETIDDLGGEAFVSQGNSLWVRVDDGYFAMEVQEDPDSEAARDLRQLADITLRTIPAQQ